MTITKDLIIPDAWAEKFDLVVKECTGALSSGVNSIKDSLVVMNGIRSLKGFFNTKEVRELVEMSQDSPAGFLTDRTDAAIFKHNKNPNKKYELKPYTYSQIVEALIPCALEGYRLHGNEINIISGKGMPVKAGKYRRILEMTNGFQESISTPAIKDGHAFIKCRAKWKIGDNQQSIGYEEGDEVHIKLPFGQWDSMDKVRGLAQSKLYTQVLTRITGRFIIDEPVSMDITDEVNAASAPTPETKAPPVPESETDHLVEEVETLREMKDSDEWKPVIARLQKQKTLGATMIFEALRDNNADASRDIIELLEQSR